MNPVMSGAAHYIGFASFFNNLVKQTCISIAPRQSRLIPSPDIGYAERQEYALQPRYGCQAAPLMASIAVEDNDNGWTSRDYCCQF